MQEVDRAGVVGCGVYGKPMSLDLGKNLSCRNEAFRIWRCASVLVKDVSTRTVDCIVGCIHVCIPCSTKVGCTAKPWAKRKSNFAGWGKPGVQEAVPLAP